MPLSTALVLSLALHLALYTLADWAGLRASPPPVSRAPLEAMLILPEIAPPPPAEPQLEEVPPPVAAPAAVPPKPTPGSPRPPAALPAIAPTAPRADLLPPAAKPPPRLFYPREAVLRGLEGEALVNVTLDPAGRVLEARIERSSGHVILDDAALSAALSLKSLPGGGRETTLPVRFRLE